MAVDRKTGKPVPGAVVPPPEDDAFREFLEDVETMIDAELDRMVAEAPPPPDVPPRGVSPLRGAYGPWLAAQEKLWVGQP